MKCTSTGDTLTTNDWYEVGEFYISGSTIVKKTETSLGNVGSEIPFFVQLKTMAHSPRLDSLKTTKGISLDGIFCKSSLTFFQRPLSLG